jgi:uncharacterized iron-regulated membrane protein
MKLMSVRQVFLKLHLWMGLGAGLLVFVLALTGTLLVFDNEIDRLLNPRLLTVAPQANNLPLADLAKRTEQAYPGHRTIAISMNPRPAAAWQVILGGRSLIFAYINPHTGEVLGSRQRDKYFMYYVHQLHTHLLLGRKGDPFVAYGTLCLMFLLLSGLYLWWQRKLLTMQTAGSFRRINFDLHNISGFYSLLFLLVVVFTGLMMSFPTLYPVVHKIAGASEDEPDEVDLPPVPAPQKGAKPITPDQALAIGKNLLPGAAPMFVNFPAGPRGSYQISFKYPEDQTPGGRSHVVLDRFYGMPTELVNSRTASKATRIDNLVRPLHTGDIFGWPSRIVFALASFSVVVQAITGVLIWWLRFRKKKAQPAERTEQVLV